MAVTSTGCRPPHPPATAKRKTRRWLMAFCPVTLPRRSPGRLALRVLGWRRSQDDAGDGPRLVPALSRLFVLDMYLWNR